MNGQKGQTDRDTVCVWQFHNYDVVGIVCKKKKEKKGMKIV